MTDVNIGVSGITKLFDKYYVLYNQHSQIDEFIASSPYQYASTIEISHAAHKDLVDMVADPSSSCLYVSDKGKSCIWHVDISSTAENHVSKWSDVDGVPGAMSLASNGHLLVLNITRNRLDIFNRNNSEVRSIIIPEELEKPRHAVETSAGTYLICHGYVEYRAHRVCEISANGEEILCQFGNASACGNGPSDLNLPWYLFLCPEKQSIFIADMRNNRVLVLNEQLNPMLKISADRYQPTRIFYDNEVHSLIIGTADRGIKLFEVDELE